MRWRASDDMAIDPRAIASRSVTGLSPTSTILTRPRASKWVSGGTERRRLALTVALREKEREAFERDGEIHAFQLHVGRRLHRARRKIQHRFDPRGDDEVEYVLRRRGGHREHRDADPFALRDFLQIVDVVDRHAEPRLLPHLLGPVVEQRGDLEPFPPNSPIVGQREPEVAGAHDRHAQLLIETENLAE